MPEHREATASFRLLGHLGRHSRCERDWRLSYLIREGFSSGAVDQVIQFYRETLEIVLPKETAHDSPPDQHSQETKMHEPVGPVQSPAPMPQAATGKPFTVAFDGVMLSGTIAITSVKDIDRLMKVLQAQKAAFEAMQGDDYDDREGGPSAERPN